MSEQTTAFKAECRANIEKYGADTAWKKLSLDWLTRGFEQKYMYNFETLGRPIIQTPVDMVALQELIWDVKPDLIVETGIAHGGSLIMSASMLALLDYCEAVDAGVTLDPRLTRRRVLGVDIDIHAHNRAAIEAHPMAHRIDMMQGSSIDLAIVEKVRRHSENSKRVLVCLDSNHTHEHVLAELESYAPLTSPGSYCIVFDTIVEDLPDNFFRDRPWGRGNNAKTAVWEYLRRLHEEGRAAQDGASLHLEIDKALENKLMMSVAPDGYLKRVSQS